MSKNSLIVIGKKGKKKLHLWNFLIEVWYEEKPEIVVPNRIQKIKEFVCLASKSFDLL
ncbi:hypothetical protein RhiirC2_741077 [Rhizophagus irregularis]|uniref:Uncharacterized protein n=1 Tax=Rhizophagus irregularis TaxID=588596 RepID=A0A2N1NH78_9GLOM|nr:hypothetical protein RhiirC2_741077 [Rhizophagus irregularis]